MASTITDVEYNRIIDDVDRARRRLNRPSPRHYSPNTGFALVRDRGGEMLASYLGSKSAIEAFVAADDAQADACGEPRTDWLVVKLDTTARIYPRFATGNNVYVLVRD